MVDFHASTPIIDRSTVLYIGTLFTCNNMHKVGNFTRIVQSNIISYYNAAVDWTVLTYS